MAKISMYKCDGRNCGLLMDKRPVSVSESIVSKSIRHTFYALADRGTNSRDAELCTSCKLKALEELATMVEDAKKEIHRQLRIRIKYEHNNAEGI